MWQARMALRAGPTRVHAAHGYVDNAYRPSRLPFVSVVGPLAFNIEPEREAGRPGAAQVSVPGHVIGRPRSAGDVVPNNGTLRIRFDTRTTITLTGLPGGSFANDANGPSLAQAITSAMRAALAGDPLEQAVLCRWDAAGKRLAIISES